MPKLLSFSNTAWYLYNYRVPLDRILEKKGWDVVMASPDGEFREELQQAGYRWHEIPMSRSGLNPIGEYRTARRLARIIDEEQPDILHTFTMKGNINGSLAARLVGYDSVVNSIAGLGYVYSSQSKTARALRPIANVAYRWALSRGETVFQNVQDLEVFLEDRLVAREHAHLIRSSGVDVSEFVPSEVETDGPTRILFASRLLWTKGVGELIKAARILKSRDIKFELVVAGQPDPGNPSTITAAHVSSWVQEGLITYLGFSRDMAAIMKSCQIACFPSKHREGVPRFLVEAAAAGLPIVTTRNGGCLEISRHNLNALIVPIGDADSLANALETLIKNPAARSELGAEGRLIAENEFSVERVASETLAVYEKLLEK